MFGSERPSNAIMSLGENIDVSRHLIISTSCTILTRKCMIHDRCDIIYKSFMFCIHNDPVVEEITSSLELDDWFYLSVMLMVLKPFYIGVLRTGYVCDCSDQSHRGAHVHIPKHTGREIEIVTYLFGW